MNSSELALYLEAGFIDLNIETDERFLPKILTNNQQKQVKVLENLTLELEKSCRTKTSRIESLRPNTRILLNQELYVVC